MLSPGTAGGLASRLAPGLAVGLALAVGPAAWAGMAAAQKAGRIATAIALILVRGRCITESKFSVTNSPGRGFRRAARRPGGGPGIPPGPPSRGGSSTSPVLESIWSPTCEVRGELDPGKWAGPDVRLPRAPRIDERLAESRYSSILVTWPSFTRDRGLVVPPGAGRQRKQHGQVHAGRAVLLHPRPAIGRITVGHERVRHALRHLPGRAGPVPGQRQLAGPVQLGARAERTG